jgi:hypothetical protein
MPDLAYSATANVIAAQALYDSGKNATEVASTLGISISTACRLRNQALLDPDLIKHASKTVSDKLTLVASLAADEALEAGITGKFKTIPAKDLTRIAATSLEAAGAHAAASGSNTGFGELSAVYGLEGSHSVSRVTLTKSITVEQSGPQPVVVNPTEKT